MKKMPIHWERLTEEMETLCAQGQGRRAAEKIERLSAKRVPPRFAYRIAAVSRRVGLPDICLRILNPIVRPKGTHTGGSDRERALYAGALTRIGAETEALSLLKSIDVAAEPQALLFRAHAFIVDWNYLDAIPELERFLSLTVADPGQQVIGNLNLAAALIHEKRLAEAKPVLDELARATREQNLTQFYGNAMELSAQWAVESRDWKAADHFLELAERSLREIGGLELLFVDKWRAFLALARNPGPVSFRRVSEVAAAARTLAHWETVRDCDFNLAVAQGDTAALVRLYFSTPTEAFRRRVVDALGAGALPNRFAWRVDGAAIETPAKTCSVLCEREADRAGLKPYPFRLLQILAGDFYRPLRVGAIHARLYPGEFYHPTSSAMRVYQAKKILAKWLEAEGLPLTIANLDGSYRLEASAPLALIIPRHPVALTSRDEALEEVRRRLPGSFTAEDVRGVLQKPRRTVVRWLGEWLAEGALLREGKGSAARYCALPPAR